MSVVIVGGHDRMHRQYKEICKSYGCKCKVFTQYAAKMASQIGTPDLLVLFTNTVSHKMVTVALDQAKRCAATVERYHSSSTTALEEVLKKHCSRCDKRHCCFQK